MQSCICRDILYFDAGSVGVPYIKPLFYSYYSLLTLLSEFCRLLLPMGGSSSTASVVRYVDVPALPPDIEKQQEEMVREVGQISAAITEDVLHTVNTKEDAVVMEYNNLKDISKISNDVEKIFSGNPAKDSILEIAVPLLEAMTQSKEMKEATRWHRAEQVVTQGDKVFGLELHCRMKIIDETKGFPMINSKKHTSCVIGYKVMVHSMNLNPEDYPTRSEMKQLTF